MAATPKEDGSVRLIHDGSRPIGAAMNDYSQPDTVDSKCYRMPVSWLSSYIIVKKISLYSQTLQQLESNGFAMAL